MKLLMLKGLPGSGKSTYAKDLVKENWVRVNKDDLRELMHGGKWSKENEREVLQARDLIIRTALAAEKNVVVDDTNLAPRHEIELKKIAEDLGAEFETNFFNTDLDVCIERDLKREKSVGQEVIHRMYRQYIAPKRPRIGSGKPKAVIFDIDGTLAIMGDRSPYDWSRVGEDQINESIKHLKDMFHNYGFKVLIFSGRPGSCQPETEKWLEDNEVLYDELHMRPTGDNRRDYQIKKEFYDECSRRYDIIYAVDDRIQVCRLWHELGLCLLKVGDPELKF